MRQRLADAPPIAVIGMAARFPGADDIEQYWANLVAGVESVSREDTGAQESDGTHVVRAVAKVHDVEMFDADYFHVPPAEAVTMDPQQRVLLEVAVQALEDAGYAGERDAVVGVFVGSGENHYFREFVAPRQARAGQADDVRVTLANEKDFLAPRVAFKLGLTGPAITVQTGCATALSAVSLACASLAAGDCDIALAGGVSLLMPDYDEYTYTEGGILSPDGRCRAFDAEASGTVPGSGAGIVVLKRDADAQADRDHRRAVIRGWAVNNDGGSRAGFTVPNIDGQEAVIRTALARAKTSPDQVGYVEAHGTGTAIGDVVEFEALRRVFGTVARPAGTCLLGSVKTNIGHTDAAAGVAGLIKATMAVERALVPGTLHYRTPNPEFDLESTPFVISAETRHWPGDGPRIAGVSSFGLGGSNAHVVVESVPSRTAAGAATRPRQVLALSARTADELVRLRERLADRLERMETDDAAALADVAYTLAVGRARFTHRWAAAVADRAEAVTRLREPADPGRSTARWSLSVHGTPAELAELAGRLVATEPLVRAAIAELGADTDLGGVAEPRAGALAVLGVAGALRRVGLSLSRVDAPRWARPAARWLAGGADPASLQTALDSCTDDDDAGPAAQEGTGWIAVDPAFDLAEAVAAAWRGGVAIDWPGYYHGEARRRVPLPTYPFTRRRFWLDRPEPEQATDVDAGEEAARPKPAATTDRTHIVKYVERIWRSVLELDHIEHDAHFVDDLAGDSLYAVEIGARLNEELGLDLPIDLPFIAPTIAATATFVEQAATNGGTDMSTLSDDTVLVRRMDVTARLTDAVVELAERTEGGVLLETWIGRYVLDADGRVVWLLINGRRSVSEIVTAVAEKVGLPVETVGDPTRALCARLLELGLVEVATPADEVPDLSMVTV
jgi:acyl transferase domain-containing protein